MEDRTNPASAHPEWCDPELCSIDREGHHLSRAIAVNPGFGHDSALIELWLQQFAVSGRPATYLWMNLIEDEADNPFGFALDTAAHLVRSLRETLERAGVVV